jgi:co-chaperonin GroES (HSP10)
MAPKSKELALVSKTTALSTAVHLTEEHLIKSAIAVEEEVLSTKLKETRKELEALNREQNELQEQRSKTIIAVGEKNKTKELEEAKIALKKIGIIINNSYTLRFQSQENHNKKCIVTQVIFDGYNGLGFEAKTQEFPAIIIKIDLKLEEIQKKVKKLQAIIDFILEERSDIAKKERRAIASLTARHLGGKDTEEGREFLASMEKVKSDMLDKINKAE